MEEVFLKVLEMSLASCWLILALLALRLVFRRLPRRIFCALWVIVAFRLAVPISITSPFSLQPRTDFISGRVAQLERELDTGTAARTTGDVAEVDAMTGAAAQTAGDAVTDTVIGASDDVMGDAADGENVDSLDIEDSSRKSENGSASGSDSSYVTSGSAIMDSNRVGIRAVIFYLSVIWLIGIAAMLLSALVGYIRLRRRVAAAVELSDNIFHCDEIATPFILGVLHPLIYVPSSLSESELKYVAAHERTHLLRYDHWRKAIGFLLLCVHWFNPLVWIAYRAFSNDIELACDEAVTGNFDSDERKAYAEALLECGRQRRLIYAYPLGFGEVGVKSRVKAVLLSGHKSAFWVTVAGVILCVAIAIGFMASPQRHISLPDEPIVFESEDSGKGYMTLKWNEEGLTYVPFAPAETSLVGDCIGYRGEADDPVYVCTVSGYSEREWLIDMLGDTVSGHSEPMLWREVHNTDIPEGWTSEYEWNDFSELSRDAEPSEENAAFIHNWAEAFLTRDGEAIVGYSTDEVIRSFEARGLLDYGTTGKPTFGYNAMHPQWEPSLGYRVIFQDDYASGAEIIYYALVNNLQVIAYCEDISFERADGEYRVTAEDLRLFDAIDNFEDFKRAYDAGINGTPMDYLTNGYGSELEWTAMLSSSSAHRELFTPTGAARVLLNLTTDANKVEITESGEAETVGAYETVDVLIRFPETDEAQLVTMVRTSDYGLWLPQDYGSASESVEYDVGDENGAQTMQYNTERSIPLTQLDESRLHWAKNGNLLYVEATADGETLYYVDRSVGDESVTLIPFSADEMAKKARQAIRLKYDETTNSYLMYDRSSGMPVAFIRLIDDVYVPISEEVSFSDAHFVESGDKLLVIFKGIPIEVESDSYFGYLTLEVGVNVSGANGGNVDFTLSNPGTYAVGGVEE